MRSCYASIVDCGGWFKKPKFENLQARQTMTRVNLLPLEKFTFFLLPIILTGLAIVPLYFFFTGRISKAVPTEALLISSFILFFISIVAFIRLRNSLRFHTIYTDLNKGDSIQVIRKIFIDHNWISTQSKRYPMQMTGNGFNSSSFDFRSWGEMMTVEFGNRKIYVNSICDPDGLLGQAFSFGKNRQNVKRFEILFLTALLEVPGY
jgi:hypothetical protein